MIFKDSTLTCGRFSAVTAAILGIAGLAGCSSLEFLETNRCGNLVVERAAGEDCDGESGCQAPGTPHECRFTCEMDPTKCPSNRGYQCGADGVCRRPAGEFIRLTEHTTVTARDMLAGDMNADGCAEIIIAASRSTELTAFTSQKTDLCVAAEQVLSTSRLDTSGASLPPPEMMDLSPSDGVAQLSLILPTHSLYGDGLSVYFTNGAPTVSPILFPRFPRPGSSIRTLPVKLRGADAVLLLEQVPGAAASDVSLIFDPRDPPQTFPGAFAGNVGDIAAIIAADVDVDYGNLPGPESRCDEIILGRYGQPQLELFELCEGANMYGFSKMSNAVVTLKGTSMRDRSAAIAAADENGDQCIDLIANAKDKSLHIAYGLCDGRFHSLPPGPMLPPVPDQMAEILNDPTTTDAGQDDRIFVALEYDDKHPGIDYVAMPCPPFTPFNSPTCAPAVGGCQAIVADIDADGDDDIVATEGQSVDVTVFRQMGGGSFHVSFLSTSCPPQYLGVGDFDHDGVNDIAYFDQTSKGPGQNVTSLSIAYGNAFASPDAPLASGRFDEARGLAPAQLGPPDSGTQIALARTYGVGMTGSALGVVEVGSERAVNGPFYISNNAMGTQTLDLLTLMAYTPGQFSQNESGATNTALAVVTQQPSGMASSTIPALWLVDPNESAESFRAISPGTSADIPCVPNCMLAALPSASGGLDRLLLLGDKVAVIYSAGTSGFQEDTRFNTDYVFLPLLDFGNPSKNAPRPIVGDINGDGMTDVLVRASSGLNGSAGELVAFYGQADGSFNAQTILQGPDCGGSSVCGNFAAAQINVDTDPTLEMAVVGPGVLTFFDVDESTHALIEMSSGVKISIPPPAVSTDYTALAAADIDADGVSDLILMSTSNFYTVLRGRPEHE